jgi:hypothetical protein
MLKSFYFIFFLLFAIASQAQITPQRPIKDIGNFEDYEDRRSDTTGFKKHRKIKLSGKTHFTDYKIISYKKDTTYIDTTLTIHKDYLFNYLNKDNFELLPFHNQGQRSLFSLKWEQLPNIIISTKLKM